MIKQTCSSGVKGLIIYINVNLNYFVSCLRINNVAIYITESLDTTSLKVLLTIDIFTT